MDFLAQLVLLYEKKYEEIPKLTLHKINILTFLFLNTSYKRISGETGRAAANGVMICHYTASI